MMGKTILCKNRDFKLAISLYTISPKSEIKYGILGWLLIKTVLIGVEEVYNSIGKGYE